MDSSPEADSPKHLDYMKQTLSIARQAPITSSNYSVGAILVDASANTILTTGCTLECPGNTHAEQCCFIKYAQEHNVAEEHLEEVLPAETVLYTTMEPCGLRLSGNLPCVDRIIGLGRGIKTVYVGVLEPKDLAKENFGKRRLDDAGVRVVSLR